MPAFNWILSFLAANVCTVHKLGLCLAKSRSGDYFFSSGKIPSPPPFLSSNSILIIYSNLLVDMDAKYKMFSFNRMLLEMYFFLPETTSLV